MKIVIIINNARLTPELKSELLRPDLTEKYGIQYDTFFPEANEFATTLKNINFQSYNACLIGGGDGTVRSIVEAMYDKNIPLVILPLGTFNLLAKSLNYPDSIEAIFEIIKNNKTKQMDVVFVNDLLVMNHAWIGFYYYILKERKKHRAIIGKNRLKKIIFNTIFLFKKLPIYQLAFKANQQDFQYKTCLVFISNNESYLNFTDFGEHKTLSTG
ncbi:MAG TPA: acylglycerol kinase family protein, partial [Gammaproteobacteria bacterium]|nr:acylglycerol kinase family protein [Gammaproteobacteria bacterium]